MTNYPTLSDDRHSLLCVSEVLEHVIKNDGKRTSGAAELADKALREVIDRMGAVEDGERHESIALDFLDGEARWLEAHAAVIHAAVLHDGMPSILQTCLAGVIDNLEVQASRLRNAGELAED